MAVVYYGRLRNVYGHINMSPSGVNDRIPPLGTVIMRFDFAAEFTLFRFNVLSRVSRKQAPRQVSTTVMRYDTKMVPSRNFLENVFLRLVGFRKRILIFGA